MRELQSIPGHRCSANRQEIGVELGPLPLYLTPAFDFDDVPGLISVTIHCCTLTLSSPAMGQPVESDRANPDDVPCVCSWLQYKAAPDG